MRDRLQQNRARLAALLLVVTLAVGFTACDENRYHQAAQAANAYSFALATAQDVEIGLYKQAMVSPDEHAQVQQLFKETALAGKELTLHIQTAKDNQTVITSLTVATDSLNRLLESGVLHIKNAEAQTSIRVALGSAKTALATIAALGKS